MCSRLFPGVLEGLMGFLEALLWDSHAIEGSYGASPIALFWDFGAAFKRALWGWTDEGS